MSDHNHIIVHAVLLCGRTVPKDLFDSVHRRVLKRVPELEHGKPYTAEMICGEEYWNPLHNKTRRQAGLIMAHLVDAGLVPFAFVSPRDAKLLWYVLV
jgi:hypothetical protein